MIKFRLLLLLDCILQFADLVNIHNTDEETLGIAKN